MSKVVSAHLWDTPWRKKNLYQQITGYRTNPFIVVERGIVCLRVCCNFLRIVGPKEVRNVRHHWLKSADWDRISSQEHLVFHMVAAWYIITMTTIRWKGRRICKFFGCLLIFRDEFRDFGASFLICQYHRAVDIGSPSMSIFISEAVPLRLCHRLEVSGGSSSARCRFEGLPGWP